jgi:hypothetical protein
MTKKEHANPLRVFHGKLRPQRKKGLEEEGHFQRGILQFFFGWATMSSLSLTLKTTFLNLKI